MSPDSPSTETNQRTRAGNPDVSPIANPVVGHILAEVDSSRPALWTGVYVGALLNIVMIAALVAANRIPSLEPYALERNAASYGLFVLLLLVPLIRFLKRPVRMFTAGMAAWVLFVAGYNLAGFYFHSLFTVLRTPGEALMEGSLIYGVAAVVSWVAGMILHARHHSIAPRRRPAHHILRDHR